MGAQIPVNVKSDKRMALSPDPGQKGGKKLPNRVQRLVDPVRSPSFPRSWHVGNLEYVEGATVGDGQCILDERKVNARLQGRAGTPLQDRCLPGLHRRGRRGKSDTSRNVSGYSVSGSCQQSIKTGHCSRDSLGRTFS